MAEYRIVAKVDPSGVTQGTNKVRQDLRAVQTEAAATRTAVNAAFDQSAFDKTVGGLITRLNGLDATLGGLIGESQKLAASNASLGRSLDGLSDKSTKAAKGLTDEEKAAKAAAAAQRELEQATERVLKATDQEALELQRLNSLLGDAKRLLDAGVISQERFAKVQKLVDDGVKKGTVSIGQQRAGYTQLGFQVQDITQTLALGINPLTVLAQQGGQTASALSLALGQTGTAGRVATYIAGPWGSLILAGVTVLGSLAVQAYKSSQATEDLTEKLKKDAQETEVTRRARERFARTEEGVAAAIRDSTKATKDSIEQERSAAERANIAAKNNLAEEISIRNKTKAKLYDARFDAQFATSTATNSTDAAIAQTAADARVAALTAKGREQDALVADAEARLAQTRADLAQEAAKRAVDPAARINRQYDAEAAAARRLAVANGNVTTSLTKQLTAIEKRRRASLDAASEAKRLETTAERAGPLTGFITPVDGRVTSGFGPRRAPTAGASTFHRGIDIAAPTGTPVRAAASGIVVFAGKLPGLGNAIIVDHGGGTITEYGHLSRVLTAKNARVGQGDNIGAVGSTGISTGSHLDYRVKVGGRYVDPRGGRFKTDQTAIDVRAAEAGEKAQEKAVKDAERLDRAYTALVGKLDPLAEATKRYHDQLEDIDLLERAGKINKGQSVVLSYQAATERRASELEQATRAYKALLESINVDPAADLRRIVDGIDQRRDASLGDRQEARSLVRDIGGTGSIVAERADENSRFDDELGKLERNRQQILDMGINYDRLVEEARRRHVMILNEIDAGRKVAALESAQSTADSLLQIAEQSVGRQNVVYKALFVASKAFAIAESVVKIQQGVANAIALPFPANLGAVAAVAAQAASIVSNIQAVSLNLADGGLVTGPGTSRSDSIRANLSNGEYVVNADATASNRALLDAINSGRPVRPSRGASNDNRGGGVAAPIVRVSQYPGTEVETRESPSTGDVEIIARRAARREAEPAVARALGNPNSRVSRSVSRNTLAGRRRS